MAAPDKKPRATKAETERRIQLLVDYITDEIQAGKIHINLFQFISGSGYIADWQISDRQARNYITRAWEKFAEMMETAKNKERAVAIMRLNTLYQKSFERKDYRGALWIQAEINRMLGLNEPDKLTLDGDLRTTPALDRDIAKEIGDYLATRKNEPK